MRGQKNYEFRIMKIHTGKLSSFIIHNSSFSFVLASYFLLLLSFSGCGESKKISPPPPPLPRVEEFVPPPREEIAKYYYTGDKYPDPFIALTSRPSAPAEIVVPDINNIALKGVYSTGKEKISLLTAGGYSYYARGSKLYDSRWRLIPGFFCSHKEDGMVIKAGEIVREIKLRE